MVVVVRSSGRGLPLIFAGEENLELVLPKLSNLIIGPEAMASRDASGSLFGYLAYDSLFEAIPWLGTL